MPIHGTACAHLQYAAMLEEIIINYCVDAVIVSSMIGHTLDVFDTGLPTVYICHDFFPLCAAIHLNHGRVCTKCEEPDLKSCFEDNPLWSKFPDHTPASWLILREQFVLSLLKAGTLLVAPSESVFRHWFQHEPRLSALSRAVIPHGQFLVSRVPAVKSRDASSRLKIVVLGRLYHHKGRPLLEKSVDRLVVFSDIYLIGTGEDGIPFENREHVTVVRDYDNDDLPEIIHEIGPDVGLLLSIWPETFSFTLAELWGLGIPVVATRLGAFEDRIRDKITGWLIEPNADALVERCEALAVDRAAIQKVADEVRAIPIQSPAEMVRAYHELLRVPEYSDLQVPLMRPGANPFSALAGFEPISPLLPLDEFLSGVERYIECHIQWAVGTGWASKFLTVLFRMPLKLLRAVYSLKTK
jgi:glycosyltransferase involved in cell wall biosynthesis